jgi:hypothetical protein
MLRHTLKSLRTKPFKSFRITQQGNFDKQDQQQPFHAHLQKLKGEHQLLGNIQKKP